MLCKVIGRKNVFGAVIKRRNVLVVVIRKKNVLKALQKPIWRIIVLRAALIMSR